MFNAKTPNQSQPQTTEITQAESKELTQNWARLFHQIAEDTKTSVESIQNLLQAAEDIANQRSAAYFATRNNAPGT